MPSALPTTAPARRRWLRFSLRTFFIAVTILCCWLGWKVSAARRQKSAVAAIQAHKNCYVIYEDFEPQWLVDRIDSDLLRDVSVASLTSNAEPPQTIPFALIKSPKPLKDRDPIAEWRAKLGSNFHDIRPVFPRLADLSRIQRLQISIANFEDDDFKHLAGLKELRWLQICLCPITGAGFKQLANLQHLESLELHGCPVEDRNLEALAGLSHLNYLEIDGIVPTAPGLQHLKQLRPDMVIYIRPN